MSAINNLFLIGAGFDRALFGPRIPMNDGLLEWLFSRNHVSDWENRRQRYETDNIEEFLTRFDLDVLHSSATWKAEGMCPDEASRDHLNRTLATELRQSFPFSEDLARAGSWGKIFAEEILQPHDVLVSLNYSHLLDSLLDVCGIWSPKGGYSRYVSNMNLDTCEDEAHNQDIKNILLYKIHGSCHFHRSAFADKPQKLYINFPVDPEIFPRCGKDRHFGSGIDDRGTYIVAPSFVKTPHIQLAFMTLDAIETAGQAHNFVILGCNLRQEDQSLWLMLTRFLKGAPESRKIIIVQPNAEELREKIGRHLSWMEKSWVANIVTIPARIEDSIDELLGLIKPIHDHAILNT